MKHKPNRQCMPKKELAKQEQELERYIKQAGFKANLPDHKNIGVQKLVQVKEALKQGGEIDPAFRINKKYRHGGTK